MAWLQAHLTVDASQAPQIEALFEQLGAVSVTLADAADEPMFEPPPGATPLWQATRVTGLFDGDRDSDDLRTGVARLAPAETGQRLELEVLEDRDWERAWLDRFAPMRFGERLWIRPTGGRIDAPDAVIVELDPGLAFGTGTHPTTALCLTWLDRHLRPGTRIIDFGCGSGILGIAALKLGAARVLAIDHDPQALAATRRNAERNGVAQHLRVMSPTDFGAEQADLVIANILANVLIDLREQLAALVRPQGDLVMSGILADQADAVSDAYQGRFTWHQRQQAEDWMLLHGSRRS